MVTYLAWIERDTAMPMEEVDRLIRAEAQSQGHAIRPGAPVPYWRKEGKASVQISCEHFPGAQPIWLWEA